MARYCFYCGKELEKGEYCNCRERQNRSFKAEYHQENTEEENTSDNTQKTTSEEKYKNEQTKEKPSIWKSISNRSKAFFSSFKQKHSTKSKNASTNQNFTDGQQFTNTRKATGIGGFFTGVQFFHQLFTKPMKTIQDAKRASIRRILITNILSAFVFSLLIFTFVSMSSIARVGYLQQLGLNPENLLSRAIFSMLRGFFAALAVGFIRVLLTYLVLRFIARQKHDFTNLYRIYLPGTYYEIIIMLFSLIFVSGHGLRAIVMLIAAFSLRMVTDFLSLRTNIHLNDDRLLVQFSIIHVFLFIILSFFLNFSVPSIANFDILPNRQEEVFIPNIKSIEELERI